MFPTRQTQTVCGIHPLMSQLIVGLVKHRQSLTCTETEAVLYGIATTKLLPLFVRCIFASCTSSCAGSGALVLQSPQEVGRARQHGLLICLNASTLCATCAEIHFGPRRIWICTVPSLPISASFRCCSTIFTTHLGSLQVGSRSKRSKHRSSVTLANQVLLDRWPRHQRLDGLRRMHHILCEAGSAHRNRLGLARSWESSGSHRFLVRLQADSEVFGGNRRPPTPSSLRPSPLSADEASRICLT